MKKESVFGTIRAVHEIGDVLVNEAERDGEISFHTFVKANDGWKDTRHAWPTLPQAVTFGFAWNAFANANEAAWSARAAFRVLAIDADWPAKGEAA